jgi:hypothetical protein
MARVPAADCLGPRGIDLKAEAVENIGERRQQRCGIDHLIPSDIYRRREAAGGSCRPAISEMPIDKFVNFRYNNEVR